MTKKTFLFNTTESVLYEKLLINKKIAPKSYVRTIWKKNVSIKIMDDSYSIADFFKKTKIKEKSTKKEILKLKKKKKKQGKKKEKLYEEGETFKLDKHVLRHKRWNNLQIEIPLIPNIKNKNLINNYATKLFFFKKKTNVWSTKLTPEKGGYTVRSFGILGFLSTKQALIASIPKQKLKTKNSYFSTVNRFKLKIGQRIPFLVKKAKWKFLKKNHWKTKKRKFWLKKRNLWIKRRKKKLKNKFKVLKKSLKYKKKNFRGKWLKNYDLNKKYNKPIKKKNTIGLIHQKKIIKAEENPKKIDFYQAAIKRILNIKPNIKNYRLNIEINRFFTFKNIAKSVPSIYLIKKDFLTQEDEDILQKLLNISQKDYILRKLLNLYQNIYLKKKRSKKKNIRNTINFKSKKKNYILKKIKQKKISRFLTSTKKQKIENEKRKHILIFSKRREASLKSPFIFYSKKNFINEI